MRMIRSVPRSRSVTRMSPLRRNAIPHGWSSPVTIGTTRMRGCSAVYSTTGRSGGGRPGTPRSAEAPVRFCAPAVVWSSAAQAMTTAAASAVRNGVVRVMDSSPWRADNSYRNRVSGAKIGGG